MRSHDLACCQRVPSELIAWGVANSRPELKAGDRIRTGDVQLGKLTFYH